MAKRRAWARGDQDSWPVCWNGRTSTDRPASGASGPSRVSTRVRIDTTRKHGAARVVGAIAQRRAEPSVGELPPQRDDAEGAHTATNKQRESDLKSRLTASTSPVLASTSGSVLLTAVFAGVQAGRAQLRESVVVPALSLLSGKAKGESRLGDAHPDLP